MYPVSVGSGLIALTLLILTQNTFRVINFLRIEIPVPFYNMLAKLVLEPVLDECLLAMSKMQESSQFKAANRLFLPPIHLNDTTYSNIIFY